MRIRATVAALSGALALSALTVPAAQADGPSFREEAAAFAASHGAPAARSAFGAAAVGDLDVSFSDFKIAKTVKVGTTNKVSTTVTYKIKHGAGVDTKSEDFATGPYIYKGSYDAPVNLLLGDYAATCAATSSTTANCSGKIDIYPAYGELINSDAGTWKGGALALDYVTEKFADEGGLGSTLVQRYSRLTVNASPEPVKKGKTITVTGKLSRANWETGSYSGLPSGQSVALQFRTSGTSTYTNVKGVKTAAGGALKTTVTAATDGYFRFKYAGITSTAPVTAAGDFVDVR
ncbi:hypothetical protein [Streptomyces sp. KMM 9044]|uniref:hypothetical protein n=1 Tax=Streptomyces sp. KMM 9044 TaxID=2744474 RepID=UPI002150C5E1|nr:hypothetical protein [Streptomyces sp. KMM 9044]WAX79419.1 hypothetical protein HUV60_018865 [Streptomyces sp. KMM 9044]